MSGKLSCLRTVNRSNIRHHQLVRGITIEQCNCLIFVYTHLMTILSHLSRELTRTLSHSALIQGLVAVALAVGRGCGRRWQQHRVSHHLHKKGQGSFVWSTGPLLLLCLCFNTPLITQLYTHMYIVIVSLLKLLLYLILACVASKMSLFLRIVLYLPRQ